MSAAASRRSQSGSRAPALHSGPLLGKVAAQPGSSLPGSKGRDGVLALIVRSLPTERPVPYVLADHRPGLYS
jgi:hypothetical protein